MRKIQYNAPGAILVPGPNGALIRKKISATAELPFSEKNLRAAENVAIPGSVQVLEVSDNSHENPTPLPASADEACDRIVLTDRKTGNLYEVYVENGKLMMEVL